MITLIDRDQVIPNALSAPVSHLCIQRISECSETVAILCVDTRRGEGWIECGSLPKGIPEAMFTCFETSRMSGSAKGYRYIQENDRERLGFYEDQIEELLAS